MQCGVFAAILYGLIGIVVDLFLLPIMLFATQNAPRSMPAAILAAPMAIVFPIMYAAMGFVGGILSAALYNVVAGWTGGIEIDLQPVENQIATG